MGRGLLASPRRRQGAKGLPTDLAFALIEVVNHIVGEQVQKAVDLLGIEVTVVGLKQGTRRMGAHLLSVSVNESFKSLSLFE